MPPHIKSTAAAVKRAATHAIPVVVTVVVETAQSTTNNPGGSPGPASMALSVIRTLVIG